MVVKEDDGGRDSERVGGWVKTEAKKMNSRHGKLIRWCSSPAFKASHYDSLSRPWRKLLIALVR